MEIDDSKIDDAAMALLYLTLHDGYRAWKAIDYDVMNRLHEKGVIENPVNKYKSVAFTKEGREKSEALFTQMFSK